MQTQPILALGALVAAGILLVFWPQNMSIVEEPGATTTPPVATTTGSGTETGGGGGTPSPPHGTSGVRGTVLLGPTCPVMQDPPDRECDDRPYQTSVSVYRAAPNDPLRATTLVLTGTSDGSGRFTFSLPPGDYVLRARGGNVMPSCSDTPVRVPADAFVVKNVYCDTGIR